MDEDVEYIPKKKRIGFLLSFRYRMLSNVSYARPPPTTFGWIKLGEDHRTEIGAEIRLSQTCQLEKIMAMKERSILLSQDICGRVSGR